MIVYDPLWETMKKREISQYRPIKHYNFSSGQTSRLRKNMYVPTHTIGILCTILDYSISGIMELHPDDSESPFPNGTKAEIQEEA